VEICELIYLISTFSFLVFSQDFIIYIDFAHIVVAERQQLMTS